MATPQEINLQSLGAVYIGRPERASFGKLKEIKVTGKDNNITSVFRYIEIAGNRIRYICQGKGEPVLMIHGACSSLHTWQKNFSALAQYYQVFALDLPGFGFSDKPRVNYTPLFFADTVNLFIDRLRLKKVHLIGSSIGASISALVTLDYPEKVESLILIDPRVYPKKPKNTISRIIATPFIGSILLKTLRNQASVRLSLNDYYFDKTLITPALIEEYLAPLKSKGGTQSVYSTFRNLDYRHIFAARAGQIQQPTLVIWGEHDQLFPVSHGEKLVADIPQAKLIVIPQAGHLPHEERPELVNNHMLSFMAHKSSSNRVEKKVALHSKI